MCAEVLSREILQESFRRLDPERHPLLKTMSRDEMYDRGRVMAPGGLLLAHRMAEALRLAPGDRVLDLGCGRGQSSALLASAHGVDVDAVDLWIDPAERVAARTGQVRHVRADVRRGLPFASGSFHAVFSMQAFHTFGASSAMLRYLATLLGPGGRLCIAQTCFDTEVDPLPSVFSETDGWDAGYRAYHAPGWWRDHVGESGVFRVETCEEVPDGDILWEDDVLYRGDRDGWSDAYLSRFAWLFRHIAHGRTGRPRLTHFMLTATAL